MPSAHLGHEDSRIKNRLFGEEMVMKPVIEVHDIPVTQIHANVWNPNVQDDETFNMLVDEIEEEGFDEPILLVPQDREKYKEDPEAYLASGDFTIIGGEHRWKAMQVIGNDTIPAVVKDDWDEVKQKIKTVRRNLLRGNLDPQRFTKLVNDVKRVYDVDTDVIAKEMGFPEGEFQKFYRERKEREERVAKEVLEETRRELTTIDNLSSVLNQILSEYGDTVPNGFVFFVYKQETHLMVNMTKGLDDSVKRLVDLMKDQDLDATALFRELIDQKLSQESEDGSGQEEEPEG